MHEEKLHVLFSAEEVSRRVSSLAERINKDYVGKPLTIICVLKGAFMFFSDLVKGIDLRPELDFVRLASYGKKTSSSRTISFTKDVEVSLVGRHVLIVEDVVDTGHTMDFLLKQLQARGAESLRIATLVDKKERREVDVHVDYYAFSLDEGFIVGYGLDFGEKYRELPTLYVLDIK